MRPNRGLPFLNPIKTKVMDSSAMGLVVVELRVEICSNHLQ